jgi:integrase
VPLTDAQCKAASCPPDAKRKRYADSGGLYLEVTPTGSKRWFWKYRLDGAEKRMALGSYPAVGLSKARQDRDAARIGRAKSGVDPVTARQSEKLVNAQNRANTVQAVALEWWGSKRGNWSASHADRIKRRLERDIFPYVGRDIISAVKPLQLLAALRKIEARGSIETAHRALVDCRQVWRYAVATERAERDICADLSTALKPFKNESFAAITNPEDFGVLIRAIRGYRGGPVVRAALQLAPMMLLRPGELRLGEWAEVDLDGERFAGPMWEVAGRRMKRTVAGKENGPPHYVPLPKQAVAILRDLHQLTGHGKLMFPGERSKDRAISDNTLRTALLSLGYGSDIMTAHGFRASARTMLEERLRIDPRIIEAQLAHTVSGPDGRPDPLGRAYNRAEWLQQRRAMLQAWADYLDQLAAGS